MKTVSTLRRKPVERSRLQLLREDAGLGLREVASHAGVIPSVLSRVENGKAPSISTALRLARFYETTVELLFGHHIKQEASK